MVFVTKLKGKASLVILMSVLILNLSTCSERNVEDKKDVILAKVANKTISLKEFIRRAEYTIRPQYCNGSNNLHKKIVLNSLIAELMLANELGENNELEQNQQFQSYLQGRKEQVMREWLQFQEGANKIKIEDSEIQEIYNIAGRKYRVKYFNIPDDSMAIRIKVKLANKTENFESLRNQIWDGKNNSEKEVKWNPKENPEITKALFTDGIVKDAVIGPLQIGRDNHILMKVVGWTDDKAITEESKKQLWNDVKEDITKKKALKLYDKFITSTMKGKKLEFNKETFNKLAELLAPMYIKSSKEKREILSQAMFNESSKSHEFKNLSVGIKGIHDKYLFRIDDKVWTVKEFMEELNTHPLVFRSKVKKENEFAKQFRLAIADLIRDKYLTKEAYNRGYQNNGSIKEYSNMWRNSLLAQYMKDKYLKKAIPNLSDSLSTYSVIKDYLNPYIDSLQIKYSDQIEVNVEQFNKIKLTRIDVITIEQNVPYPIMVPSFPQITTDHDLDYGKRMK